MKKWFGVLLGLVLIAVPAIAMACPPQLQLNVTAVGSCVAGQAVYSVTATATPSWNGYTLQGITGAPSSSQSYSVTATWTKVKVAEHINWGSWQSGHAHGPPPVEEKYVIFLGWYHRHGTIIPTTYYTETRNVSGNIPTQDCYVQCSVTNDGTPSEWSEWVLDQDGLGYTRTRTVPVLDSVDPSVVCDTRTEYDYKDAVFDEEFTAVMDCTGVVVTEHFYRDGIEYKDPVDVETYEWVDPYGPESFQSQFFDEPFVKALDCLECKFTPLYPQAAYLDADAPASYWQGPFGMGPGVAVVIHPNGQVPSEDRVTTVASLCPDQYPGGYIYTPDNKFLDGWVYRVDCYGKEPHYMYFEYNWDEYVRLGMYDETGVRTCARLSGCTDWIHENK